MLWAVTAVLGAAALRLFGLPTVDLHAPPHYVGIMDPLCGMTRAVYALTHGAFSTAWRYNPGVFALAGFAVLMVARFVVGVTTGRWIEVTIASRRALVVIVTIVIALLWVNQQANSDLLMSR